MTQSNSNGGYDISHHLVGIHQPPESLIALREELVYHPDITSYAQNGTSFEECLGRIALKLDIALDGIYDCEPLCAMLVEALRNRRFHGDKPHLRATGLVDVELVETADGISLQERDRNQITIPPQDAIRVETDTSVPAIKFPYKGIGLELTDASPTTEGIEYADSYPSRDSEDVGGSSSSTPTTTEPDRCGSEDSGK